MSNLKPTEFVTVALGYKNSAGQWIVTDRVEQKIVAETRCAQIVVTEGKRFTLTHYYTGFFLLGGFRYILEAQMAAEKLEQLFQIDDWNVMAGISGALVRPRVRQKWDALPLEDKRWMEKWGGPKVS